MICGKTVLAIIPARGGSRGIPRKNICDLAGKPLIAWTIEEAQKSQYIDKLILSSEDQEIIAVAKEWGCEVPFVRPRELALDNTPGVDPVLHAIEALSEEYGYIVLLQPTSPLRLVQDIDGAIEMCFKCGAPVCVSVTDPQKSPYWMYTLDEKNRLHPVTSLGYTSIPRQELPAIKVLNGAVYVAETKWLKQKKTFLSPETIAFGMPKRRSWDIDTELDLEICRIILSGQQVINSD